MSDPTLNRVTKEGKIDIFFLKEIWSYFIGLKLSIKEVHEVEWKYINGVFNALGIGIEPTIAYLMNESSTFDDFENWIVKNGRVSREVISYFNSVILSGDSGEYLVDESVLNGADIKKWNEEGYIVVREAVPKDDCKESVAFICSEIGVDIDDVNTWYSPHPLKKGIMVQLFNSPVLDKNRLSKKVKLAFQQLWNRNNLMVSMDRVSFNPPESDSYKFPGPNLHWDVSLKQPIPFGLQGLLYLTDTKDDQGAFTVIPGFHNKINNWLKELDPAIHPREVNLLENFEEKPIPGKAGDLIIWNHCLPHGSRPNRSKSPRIVQYVNYQPLDLEYQNEWI